MQYFYQLIIILVAPVIYTCTNFDSDSDQSMSKFFDWIERVVESSEKRKVRLDHEEKMAKLQMENEKEKEKEQRMTEERKVRLDHEEKMAKLQMEKKNYK